MRVLNREGSAQFREWILSLGDSEDTSIPLGILSDSDFSYEIPNSPEPPQLEFPTKYELAEALSPFVKELRGLQIAPESWPGIWNALALTYFDLICPKKSDSLAPNRIEHYIFDETHSQSTSLGYRHRIFGPLTLFETNSEAVHPFFQQEPSVLGQYEESLGSRQEIAGNPTALEVVRRLYKKLGTGYTSKKQYPDFKSTKVPSPGSIERFCTLWQQLKRTYDLEGISTDAFLELLPEEFDEWLAK